MARKAFPWSSRRAPTLILLACLFFPSALVPASQTTKPDENVFDYRIAAQLMHQIGDALLARNQKKMMDAFDLAKMSDGERFRQQVSSFFAQTAGISVHFNLLEAAMEDGKGVATVSGEMEANLRDDSLTPVRKQAQLRFVAERSGDGWKFTDVEPRTFFSTAQP